MTDKLYLSKARETTVRAAEKRIHALFAEQRDRGEVYVAAWQYGLSEPECGYSYRLDMRPGDRDAVCLECRTLLEGMAALVGIFDSAPGLDRADLIYGDRCPDTLPPALDGLRQTWLSPLTDEDGGGLGFRGLDGDRPTEAETLAASARIGASVFAADTIAHARRLCRFIQLNAPDLLLETEAKCLAEALVLHRFSPDGTIMPHISLINS